MTTMTTPANLSMQGTQVSASSVDAKTFFANTRRQNLLFRSIGQYAGPGETDIIQALQTGILSQMTVRVSGTLTVDLGTSGTCTTTSAWPYGILQTARFAANGQSNLINCSGTCLKLMQVIMSPHCSDRGVSRVVNGNTVTQGTLSMASESWGVGGGDSVAAGSYDVQLIYQIPVAFNDQLLGAIFSQTNSTNLELALSWAQTSALFTLASGATVTFTPSVLVEGTVYTIPSVGGEIKIPNLTAFHQLIETRAPNDISNGANEITLAGQGVGRKLMRLGYRVLSGGVPLAQTEANYSGPYWRYGGNTTPETFADGRRLAQFDEDLYDSAIGDLYGYGVFDFSKRFAQRDSVDEGKHTQLRFGFSINDSVDLTAPTCTYFQQTIVAGAGPA